MSYLIVPVGIHPPQQEGAITNMDIMFLVTTLGAIGLPISIKAALAIWNRLARSDRWVNSKEALNDQDFWAEFTQK